MPFGVLHTNLFWVYNDIFGPKNLIQNFAQIEIGICFFLSLIQKRKTLNLLACADSNNNKKKKKKKRRKKGQWTTQNTHTTYSDIATTRLNLPRGLDKICEQPLIFKSMYETVSYPRQSYIKGQPLIFHSYGLDCLVGASCKRYRPGQGRLRYTRTQN